MILREQTGSSRTEYRWRFSAAVIEYYGQIGKFRHDADARSVTKTSLLPLPTGWLYTNDLEEWENHTSGTPFLEQGQVCAVNRIR